MVRDQEEEEDQLERRDPNECGRNPSYVCAIIREMETRLTTVLSYLHLENSPRSDQLIRHPFPLSRSFLRFSP